MSDFAVVLSRTKGAGRSTVWMRPPRPGRVECRAQVVAQHQALLKHCGFRCGERPFAGIPAFLQANCWMSPG